MKLGRATCCTNCLIVTSRRWTATTTWHFQNATGEKKNCSGLVAALKRCSKAGDLEGGKRLHRDAVLSGWHTSSYVASALINMYCKCGSMSLAQEVFDRANLRDTVLWNCLIRGYVENGESSAALNLLQRIDCDPDPFTYAAGLKACACLASENDMEKAWCLQKGTALHREVVERGFGSDIVLASALVHMYGKCGSMSRAADVFRKMERKNVVTWTSLIQGYVENGESEVAMEVFSSMDCEPNSQTFVVVLKVISRMAVFAQDGLGKDTLLKTGLGIHERIKTLRYDSNVIVANALMDMYSRCGRIQAAHELFQGLLCKNVVSWNTLAVGYVENDESVLALELLSKMDCQPDRVTYIAALKACAGLASHGDCDKEICLAKGIFFHERIKDGELGSDTVLATALIDMYSKHGSISHAQDVFDRVRSKNTVTWTCLMQGYVDNGDSSKALDMFDKMDCEPNFVTYVAALKACGSLASERELEKQLFLEKGLSIHAQIKACRFESNILVVTALVDMYFKCGSSFNAREVFDRSSHKDVVLWNCLISGYVENGENSLAMELFNILDCKPNLVTYISALKACGSLNSMADGKDIHSIVCKLGLEEEDQVKTALVDFYGKSGYTKIATELFSTMNSPGIVLWNTLLTGFSSVGHSAQVFTTFREIEEAGVQMDRVTFIAILTACSHAGLVEEGKMYFENMHRQYGVDPGAEHFSIIVDMLGRINKLDEAFSLIRSKHFEADSITWMTLLGACRKWNNLEVGKAAFDALVVAETQDGAAYVLMSGILESLSTGIAHSVISD